MKVIFLGSPEFGSVVLDYLVKSKHQVVATVCQMDKPSGRGNKLTPPPVKVYAMQNNIPVYQFQKIRRDGVETLKSLNADIMVTAAYGQILSQEIIDICPHKIINVHGSLLPKLRGATPIQKAIWDGETVTGVTIMHTDAGIDTGDMIKSEQVEILETDTYGSLSEKLAHVGGRLAVEVLDQIEQGTSVYIKQNDEDATYTKMIKKEDCLLDFNKPAKQLFNQIRALNPNPVAYFMIGEQNFKVYSSAVVDLPEFNNAKNGEVVVANSKKGLIIKCGTGFLQIDEMLAPNSKKMPSKSYLNGKSIQLGVICNE